MHTRKCFLIINLAFACQLTCQGAQSNDVEPSSRQFAETLEAYWPKIEADFERVFEVCSELQNLIPFEIHLLLEKVGELYQLHRKASRPATVWTDSERVRFVALVGQLESLFDYDNDNESSLVKFLYHIAENDLANVMSELWSLAGSFNDAIFKLIPDVARRLNFPAAILANATRKIFKYEH